ncbi:SPOR domain-containing protein [Nesterenkonia sp. Act20]|uniref:SPOR domain-containing protein n=1 Tax=Nesterenkonia sp. Act20 TaxID=1483432 RepID=UPI001C47E0B7|nr:SPOR domain-containing protein [Nesterenkonia sp. Act20]
MSTEYWFNVRTQQIEEGAQSSWKHLLGPYASREEASEALKRVEENNEAWDDEEEEFQIFEDGGESAEPSG